MATFREIRRVLKPDGICCVIEPDGGPLNIVMRHFHDEDAVRAAAQKSLHEIAVPMFQDYEEFTYHSVLEFESFEEYAQRYASKTFNLDYTAEDIRRDQTRKDFERLGAPDYRFPSPKRTMLLRNLSPE